MACRRRAWGWRGAVASDVSGAIPIRDRCQIPSGRVAQRLLWFRLPNSRLSPPVAPRAILPLLRSARKSMANALRSIPPEAVAQGVTRFKSVRPELWRSDRSSSFQRDDGASGPMRPGAKTNTVRRQDAPLLYLLTDILQRAGGGRSAFVRRQRRSQLFSATGACSARRTGAERIAGDPVGAIAAIVAPCLAVVVPAVDPRSVVIAVDPGPAGARPEADAWDVDGAPGARGYRHFPGIWRGRVAGHRDLRRSAGRGRQEARAGCESGDKHARPRLARLLVFIAILLLEFCHIRGPGGRCRWQNSPGATKWPRVVPLLRDQERDR